MKRTLLLVVAWTSATLLAVGVAAAAVGAVRGQVTDVPSVPIQSTATSLAAASETVVTTPTSTPATTATVPPDAAAPTELLSEGDRPGDDDVVERTTTTDATAVTATAPLPSATTTTRPSGSNDDGDDDATTSSSTSTTSAQTTSSTTSTTTTTTTTTSAPAGPTRVTYDLIGGTVVVDVGSGIVTLVGASPKGGFSVDVGNAGPEKVVVKFESSAHESEFMGRFEGMEFVPTIEEWDRSGHDGDRNGESDD